MLSAKSGDLSSRQTDCSLRLSATCLGERASLWRCEANLECLLSDKEHGERPIILAVVGLSFLSQMRGSNNVNGLLYTERKFGWSVTQYTNYKSFYVSLGTVQQ